MKKFYKGVKSEKVRRKAYKKVKRKTIQIK